MIVERFSLDYSWGNVSHLLHRLEEAPHVGICLMNRKRIEEAKDPERPVSNWKGEY
uniref:Uncharacterized protein n=1 Tax=Lepeophtheirus salmonis TaxID=72036 RepID=A0A0K2UKM1_LEPSM